MIQGAAFRGVNVNAGSGLEHALGPVLLLLVGLALGGAPIAVIGLPEAVLGTGASAGSWPDLASLVERGDMITWIALGAGYALLHLELAYVAVEMRRQGRRGAGRALVTSLLFNVAIGFAATGLLGMRAGSPSVRFAGDVLALALRWIGNPIICLYWLRSGHRVLREGGAPAVVALYAGAPILWLVVAAVSALVGDGSALLARG